MNQETGANARPVGRRIKSLFFKLATLACSMVFGLLLVELLSRMFLPIFPGPEKRTPEGKPLHTSLVFPGGTLPPGEVYRQYSHEYDAWTTVTPQGFRGPGLPGAPDVVFIGDSFTYGSGLSDSETFSSLFSKLTHSACVNLGIPGAGTGGEVSRLEFFLDQYSWKPKRVFLIMLAMTGSLTPGNDLMDNWISAQSGDNGNGKPGNNTPGPQGGILRSAIGHRSPLLRHSNLARIVKFSMGPRIKKLLAPGVDEAILNQALTLTGGELRRLDNLAAAKGFQYDIVIIHPVQDILRGTDDATISRLQQISPRKVVPTAAIFKPDPAQYYFPLDGHFNRAGSGRLAEFLADYYLKTGRESAPQITP